MKISINEDYMKKYEHSLKSLGNDVMDYFPIFYHGNNIFNLNDSETQRIILDVSDGYSIKKDYIYKLYMQYVPESTPVIRVYLDVLELINNGTSVYTQQVDEIDSKTDISKIDKYIESLGSRLSDAYKNFSLLSRMGILCKFIIYNTQFDNNTDLPKCSCGYGGKLVEVSLNIHNMLEELKILRELSSSLDEVEFISKSVKMCETGNCNLCKSVSGIKYSRIKYDSKNYFICSSINGTCAILDSYFNPMDMNSGEFNTALTKVSAFSYMTSNN